MNCKKCGATIEKGSAFCGKCGAKTEPYVKENHNRLAVQTEATELTDSVRSGKSDVSAVAKTKPNKKIIILVAGISVVVILLILVMVIALSGATERKMKKALDSCSAYEVNTLYSQAYGDSKKIAKYDKVIGQFINDAINSLNSIDFSEEEMAENGYIVIEDYIEKNWGQLFFPSDGETIESSISYANQEQWELLKNLVQSKRYFCAGVAYRDSNKQPEDAINVFKQVISEDSYYGKVDEELAKCADLYVEQTLSEAESLIAEEDISGAIDLIEGINTYLENNGLTTETVQSKLTETKNRYAESYVKKAEVCFKDKDVDGAIGNIGVAIELNPENAEYKTTKETYEMYRPFPLYIEENCLSVDEEGDFWGNLEFDQNRKSNNNKEMNHCLLWWNNSSDATVSLVATYNLDGKYDTVTGTIFLPESEKNTSFSGYFNVYGDGKLIDTSPKVTKNVLPQNIKFSVTDIHQLSIKFYGQGEGGFLGGGPDFCVSTLIAQRNFPK